MSFSSVINLGAVSPAITSVKISACTNSSCTGGSVINGYDNIPVSSFPRTISGIPDGTTYIKLEALGSCNSAIQCVAVSGLSGTPTPTPTISNNTPTPTPTATTPPTYTLNLGYDSFEKLTACSHYVNFDRVALYSSTAFSSIGQGTVIYSDYAKTTFAPNGWYSNGVNTWIVYGGGSFNMETSCNATPTPTPTATPLPGKGYLVSTGQTYQTIQIACQQYESSIGQGGYGGQLFLYNIVNPSVGDQFYTSQDCNPSSAYEGSGNNYYVVIRNDSEYGLRKWAMRIGFGGTITELNLC